MQVPKYVVLEKKCGETPLETISEWRTTRPEFADIPATYAGRLDPMASGKLLVLLGDECKNRDAYVGLDKKYEVEVVLGFGTDTGDALGMPSASPVETHPNIQALRGALRTLSGTHTVLYPVFSSKTVQGKPLFQYALEDALASIVIPEHEETIYRLQFTRAEQFSVEQLQAIIQNTLRLVPRSDEPSKVLGADFRQDVIRKEWNALFDSIPETRPFTVLTLRVTCSTGTYMRTLAERLGKELGTKVFALSIHRTKIGRFSRFGPFSYWREQY